MEAANSSWSQLACGSSCRTRAIGCYSLLVIGVCTLATMATTRRRPLRLVDTTVRMAPGPPVPGEQRPPAPSQPGGSATGGPGAGWPAAAPAGAAVAGLGPADVGWPWGSVARGGELHQEVGQVIAHGRLPAAVLDVLRLVAPEPRRCRCALERWDQYAVCRRAFRAAARALSLGINGYDPWGSFIQNRTHLVPQTFDCFNTNKPVDFPNTFSPICVGPSKGMSEGHSYTTLSELLVGATKGSVLVKMDIERSEFEVLLGLTESDWARIGSLHVEYHMNYECPSEQEWFMIQRVLWRARQNLAVVDAAAGYYAPHCTLEGSIIPKLFAVSYVAESLCGPHRASGQNSSRESGQVASTGAKKAANASNIQAGSAPGAANASAGNPETVGWPWAPLYRGGELHKDVAQVIAQERHSAEVLGMLHLVAPQPRRCQCRLERWDQYAVCREAFQASSKALSLGINGYDPWGAYVQKVHGIVPHTVDCFNTIKPADFENVFLPWCVSAIAVAVEGRNYTTLPALLAGAANRSVLVKMDIERSEFEVLLALSDRDWARISSLHVEYHMNYGCPDEQELGMIKKVLGKVREKLAVVDGAASYYSPECTYGGSIIPQLFVVSYSAESICTPQTPASKPPA